MKYLLFTIFGILFGAVLSNGQELIKSDSSPWGTEAPCYRAIEEIAEVVEQTIGIDSKGYK